MAYEPKREVLKRLTIGADIIRGEKTLKTRVDTWLAKGEEFVSAREAVEAAKKAMIEVLLPKLKGKGIEEGVNWDVKKDPQHLGGLVIEIVKGEKRKKQPRIETEEITF